MASKFVDYTATIQVIGSVYRTPQLLDFTDKYMLTDEDFPNQFHRIVFGTIYTIHELGSEKINIQTICDFLKTRPKNEAVFKAEKGEEWLAKTIENANPDSFDYYYNRLKKMTLLRAYDNIGVDVSDIYDPNNILDMKKKQMQEDFLDNSSLIELADLIDDKITKIRLQYVENVDDDGIEAGEGIYDLINKFKEHPEVGVPMYGNLVNTVTRGARLKKLYLRSGASGYGKAIPNDTIIPTPSGYRKVNEIQVGDYLFDRLGNPTKVLAVYPQKEKKQIYEVHFIDGRIAKCCKEHLWEYYYKSHGDWAKRVEDCQTILDRINKSSNKSFKNDSGGYKFKIRVNEPLNYEEKKYSVDPYVMGLILGDGSFRYTPNQKAFSFSSADEELPQKIAQIMGYICKKNSGLNYTYHFEHNNEESEHKNVWVEDIIKEYPELWNKKSEDKFIPPEYLLGSIDQRYALLRGLLDTDGTIDKKGRVSFTTISPYLRDSIIDLCHSLGMYTSYLIDKRTEKYTTGECYVVHIQCKKKIKPLLFGLNRKKEIAENYANTIKKETHKEFNSIQNIVPTDEYVDMTCFSVDNEEHLFLMNDCIVTHNSRTMAADACYIACNKIYDEALGWIRNGICQPTLFITTELTKDEVQTMFLAFLSNVNEEHILNGEYEGDEETRVLEAAKILMESPLYIKELMDFSLQDIENVIKQYIREHDILYVVKFQRPV